MSNLDKQFFVLLFTANLQEWARRGREDSIIDIMADSVAAHILWVGDEWQPIESDIGITSAGYVNAEIDTELTRSWIIDAYNALPSDIQERLKIKALRGLTDERRSI